MRAAGGGVDVLSDGISQFKQQYRYPNTAIFSPNGNMTPAMGLADAGSKPWMKVRVIAPAPV
jgi:hypothetical protein